MRRASDGLTTFGRLAAPIAAPLLAAALLLATATRGEARGALIFEQGVCVLKVGPDILYFSGYQASTGKQKFCEDAPQAGEETSFVFDIPEQELREMKIGFRILRDAGEGQEPIDGPLVAEVAPKIHPTGTFSLVHLFPEAGDYIGIVTIERGSDEVWIGRFPFSVGRAARFKTPYLLLGLAATLAVALLVIQLREKKR